MMTTQELADLVGHRFPGGEYTIDRWENVLLTDCTAREALADQLVHPIALFHIPITGAGMSIGKLFELGGGDGTAGSVTLLGYDWEYVRPLRESVAYRIDGWVDSADRRVADDGTTHDDIAFTIEMSEPDGAVAARVTNHWRFHR